MNYPSRRLRRIEIPDVGFENILNEFREPHIVMLDSAGMGRFRVIGMHLSNEPTGDAKVVLLVEHDSFDEVPDGEIIPLIDLTFARVPVERIHTDEMIGGAV